MMRKSDSLQRFIFENRSIRGELVYLNKSFQQIIAQHAYPNNINRLLGEALVCATLLSAMVKSEGRLTVQFQGTGALQLLTASATSDQHIRGFAQYTHLQDDDTLTTSLQQGKLAITFQPDQGSPYQGILNIPGVHIKEAVEAYFTQSEQLPTRLFLAVESTQAAGLLLQTLPSQHDIQEDWAYATSMAETITSDELLSLPIKTLLHRLYHADDIRLFDREPVSFRCTCSKERAENAVRLMGQADAIQLIIEKQTIEVICEFCNVNIQLDRVDIDRIFKTDIIPPDADQHH